MTMPDAIFFNGAINTFNSEENICEAVAVKEGKIMTVGSNKDVLELKSDRTKLVDLENKTVIPGFIDAHLHIFNLGINLSYVDCRLPSIKEVKESIKKRAKLSEDKNEWIIGWGFDESYYEEGRKLNKWDFENIENPVFIKRYCLHEAVVNEVGLRKVKVTNASEIENGILEKDENGELTGLLVEQAIDLVEKKLPPYTKEKLKEAIRLSTSHLLKRGVTGVHDAGLGFLVDPHLEFEVLKELNQENNLKMRVYAMILAEHYQEFMEANKFVDTEFLRIGSMKLFADGTLSGKTAAVSEPYRNTTNHGMLLNQHEYYKKYIAIAQKMDKQVAVHAIGDRAIEQILRVYEANPRPESRYRIEHTTLSNDDILKRMKKLNAIPIPQPPLINLAGDMYDVEPHLYDHIFANKSYIDHGLKPAGSSDAPVTDPSPLIGMYAAMKRETLSGKVLGGNQKIGIRDAIRMYTINAAYASFEEESKGSIEVGKYADLTVLPEGFMEYSAEEVLDANVELTIIEGEIMFENNKNK